VQARSRRNGQIFHLAGPLQWARNAALGLMGHRLMDLPWLYGHRGTL
jgi:salicylate hydroxylase